MRSCNCELGSIKAVVTVSLGGWLRRNHASRCSVKVHQMPGAMASLQSWLPAKSLSTGKWVDKLKGNQSDPIRYNCPKSITVWSEASTFVFYITSNTRYRMKIVKFNPPKKQKKQLKCSPLLVLLCLVWIMCSVYFCINRTIEEWISAKFGSSNLLKSSWCYF